MPGEVLATEDYLRPSSIIAITLTQEDVYPKYTVSSAFMPSLLPGPELQIVA